ncbi:MAG: 2-C-methyl-D-erythritol 4-phosphate cytidylyltransferase [Bacteroidota bacterium]
MKPTNCHAVIVAGGSGKRMGAKVPKQFLDLGGMPILVRTVKRFLEALEGGMIVLVLPADQQDVWHELSQSHIEEEAKERVYLCTGGISRTASVWAGIQQVYARVDEPAEHLVAIHDGVRPFVSVDVVEHAFQLADLQGGAVTCVPVKASIRKQRSDGTSEPVDRSEYWEVQTPQTFQLDAIYQAFHKRPHDQFTDDASLFQAMGGTVVINSGSYDNIKITTPEDMSVGEGILKRQY